MESAERYQGTANAMGVPLYLYPDGSVANVRKVGAEPTATIEPHDSWKPADDHDLSEDDGGDRRVNRQGRGKRSAA
jgi:hypothetical protein